MYFLNPSSVWCFWWLSKWNTKPVAEAGFRNMPTGYFLRLAELFTQSPGNLGHRGHTCTVSETKLELHSGTNQPQRPRPEYDPEGPAGLAWLQRGWQWVQLASSPPARQGEEWCVYACVCVLVLLCKVFGGRGIPAATSTSFLPVLVFLGGTYFCNGLVYTSISNAVVTCMCKRKAEKKGSHALRAWTMTVHR